MKISNVSCRAPALNRVARLLFWCCMALGTVPAAALPGAADSGTRDGFGGPYIDPRYPPGIAEREGWEYHDSLSYDFDGDGRVETLHVRAPAVLIGGKSQDDLPVMDDYAWDDGQPWQVYIEEQGGGRVYLYSRWIQLGRITILHSPNGPPILVETGTHVGKAREAKYSIRYGYPGTGRLVGAPSGR